MNNDVTNQDSLSAGRFESENIILADADYIDQVAFNLIVNFERMIGRRIQQADMSRWAECIALDGGLREGEHSTQVILVHEHQKEQMANFAPAHYSSELNGQAFRSPLGEFVIAAVTGEGFVSKADLFADTLQLIVSQKGLRRLMVVPDERQYDKVREVLRRADPDLHTTVFAMQPMAGGNFRQEILGFSLMSALGIRSDEIPAQ